MSAIDSTFLSTATGPRARRPVARLAALIFVQMLPATLVAPAIRPLFAALHDGNVGAMHAFMSVNMIGAAIAAPLIGGALDRARRSDRLLAALAIADALLLAAITLPLPIAAVLAIRTLEGAAHVGAATALLGGIAAARDARGEGRSMGAGGAAIIGAVAAGSFVGGQLVPIDPRAPFLVAAALSALVAAAVIAAPPPLAARASTGPSEVTRPSNRPSPTSPPRARDAGHLALVRRLRLPILTAFAGRFGIGCIVVSFALLAHRAHRLDDRTIGALFSVFTIGFAALVYPVARATDRGVGGALLGAGMLGYAAAIALLGFGPTAALLPAMILGGATSALVFGPTLCAAAARLAPSERARGMALLNAAGCVGMVLGPATAGITTAIASRHLPPELALRAPFAVGAAVVALVALRTLRAAER